jgi:hypothetical protein
MSHKKLIKIIRLIKKAVIAYLIVTKFCAILALEMKEEQYIKRDLFKSLVLSLVSVMIIVVVYYIQQSH